MGENRPTVSVILPTYNRAHLVDRAIQSVLDQTYQDFEVIIVSDCSTDNTDEVVNAYRDPRIVYIRHNQNKGGSAARNTGIGVAKGEYIAFLDSDDEWLPEKLEKQIKIFKTLSPEVGLVYTDMLRVHNNGSIEYWNSPTVTQGEIIDSEKLEYHVFGIGIQSTLIKRECFEKVGIFDEEFPRFIDLELFIRLAKHFGFYHIHEPLVKYYETEGISSNQMAEVTARILLLEKYFEDVKHNKKFLARQYRRIGSVLISCGDSREGRRYLIKGAKTCPLNVKALLLALISFFGKDMYVKLLKLQSEIKGYMKYLRGK
jgi:glycosyltransferase involved in cell wall biosynthesis